MSTTTTTPLSFRTMPIADHWPTLLNQFDGIGLADMVGVALMNRTDTKFVMTNQQLYRALTALTADYRVLTVKTVRLNHYQTLYFDTPDFYLYLRHHAGAPNRYKVRSREYVDSQLAFLEVKHKTNGRRTVKNRLQTAGLMTRFTPQTGRFINTYSPLDSRTLEPKLHNDFSRITLVGKQIPERVTLDLNLQFGHDDEQIWLDNVAIAEVKQSGINRYSPFMRQMRDMGLRPTGFSKYCLGVSLLYRHVKHNNFNAKLRLIDKLSRGKHHGYYYA